jgi:hypothetical protein
LPAQAVAREQLDRGRRAAETAPPEVDAQLAVGDHVLDPAKRLGLRLDRN